MTKLWQDSGLVFSMPVRDPIWKNILLPAEFGSILATPDFIKLGRIAQLGPAALVYPGATHTRRAHSLGVYHLARRILEALATRYPDFGLDPLAVRSFLVAALCHDLGHFPFTHSLKELPLVEHEVLSANILRGPMADAVLSAGADPELAAAIIDSSDDYTHPDLDFFRRLLSGVLDPDKLDYLNRDAWACGVPYGTQDVDYILQHLALTPERSPAIDERGVMSVEAVLFSKYQMYRAVYWHRTVRAATAMIKKAVLGELRSGRLHGQDLYGLDDPGFYNLMNACAEPAAKLVSQVLHGNTYHLCLEQVFDPGRDLHTRCLDLEQRSLLESELSAILSGRGEPVDVVLDLPEPISFESSLTVLGSGQLFSAVSTVFGQGLVGSFERSLRVFRVFCSRADIDQQALRSWHA